MEKADFKNHMNSIPKPSIVTSTDINSEIISDTLEGKNDLNSQHYLEPQLEEPKLNIQQNTSNNLIDHDPDEVWKIVKEHIRMHVSPREFTAWYTGVFIEKISNGVATISCDNSMKREWIESYHKNFIKTKIGEIIGYKPDLMITIRSSGINEEVSKDTKYEYYDPNNVGQQSLFSTGNQNTNNSTRTQTVNSNLNPKYLLNNFVVGKSNQLAYAVAESVVNEPGTVYNPLFFYGPSGVGKTHLMQAIGNAILHRNNGAKVLYVPIETFLNEMIEAIRTNKNDEFRKKYRPADVLIIDDIQFISNYIKTQEELFNTFNALYESNKQIVIASDRPPHEIDNLPERLRTRFQGGMVVDIQSPDLETRIAILQQEVRNGNIEIPSEIILFIAQNVENSVRELEGAITKVITLSKINQQVPDLDDVAKMLQVDIDSKRKRVSTNDVINVVADVFDVTPMDIKGKRRTAYVALARQIVMYLLREELEMPLEKVAQQVNRKDHTTVLHACEKISELINKDQRIKEKIEKCKSVFSA